MLSMHSCAGVREKKVHQIPNIYIKNKWKKICSQVRIFIFIFFMRRLHTPEHLIFGAIFFLINGIIAMFMKKIVPNMWMGVKSLTFHNAIPNGERFFFTELLTVFFFGLHWASWPRSCSIAICLICMQIWFNWLYGFVIEWLNCELAAKTRAKHTNCVSKVCNKSWIFIHARVPSNPQK